MSSHITCMIQIYSRSILYKYPMTMSIVLSYVRHFKHILVYVNLTCPFSFTVCQAHAALQCMGDAQGPQQQAVVAGPPHNLHFVFDLNSCN